jgi:tetratricopeptide (TPR) repeat protein
MLLQKVSDRAYSLVRLGKLRIALQYLERALDLEQSLPSNSSKADTHLNICAVLSQLGRHDLAYHHAQNAIIIVQSTLLKAFLPKRSERTSSEAEAHQDQEIEKNFKDRIAVLAIA